MQGFLWCDKKMGKLEKTLLTFGLAGTLAFGNGCASAVTRQELAPEQNYEEILAQRTRDSLEAIKDSVKFERAKKENHLPWFGAAVTTHITEMAATKYGFDNGFQEGHPVARILYGENPSIERMALVKGLYLGAVYGLGEAYPKWRKGIYQSATAVGAFATLWNVAQFIFNPQKEE